MHLLAKEFWEFRAGKTNMGPCIVSYIRSSRNKVADKESRKLTDNLELSLKEKFFQKIVGKFGPVTTDLFPSRVNCKVS